MPIFAAWIASAFTALVTFFGGFLAKRLALAAAAVVAISAAFALFYASLTALLSGAAIPFPTVDGMYNCFLPTNIKSCISIILSAKMLRWVYDWQNRIIQFKLGI